MTGEYKDGYDLPISWSSDMKTTYCPTGSTYKTLYLADGYQVKELPMNMELNRYGFPDRYNKINEHSINNNLVYQLGIPLLSQFDLEELCKKSIDEVAAKVNTLADLLNYMTVKGICTYEGDMKAILSDKKCWQFNRNAKTINKTKFADCGGSANFANYLLKGDYDEVGYIDYTFGFGKGGGHVTNYLKKGNLYFFYDLTSWLTNYNIKYFIINSFTNMDQYATWASTDKFYKISNLIASFVAENDLPINWDDLDQEITYYDSSYKLNVILARNGAKFIPLDISNEDKARIDYRRDID